MSTDHTTPDPFRQLPNLADPRLGAAAVFATDEWFAPCARMLQTEAPVFIPGKFDDNGKWMDGWETRRKRAQGHDYAVVRLGRPGVIRGVDIDTTHFTGNYPPAASIDACLVTIGDPGPETVWREILPSVGLRGDNHHLHAIPGDGIYSHLRLNIYPDGGIARLRVYGLPQYDGTRHESNTRVDLVALENGGRAITCNDQHFGSILNLNLPGRGINMGDGWETRRRREPGNDWALLELGHPGTIREVVVDTAHFKGNYPDRCSLQAAYVGGGTDQSLVAQSLFWKELLPPQKLEMDSIRRFQGEVQDIGPITHVRLNIFPDGGISRLRLFGEPEAR